MAFAQISGGFWGGESKTAGTSVATSRGGVSAAAGSFVVVHIGLDNVQTTDGQTSHVSAVSDSAGNTYTKVIEFTNGQGGAASGATASLWCCVLTNAITSSTVITATHSSVTARAITAVAYTKGAGTTVSWTGTATLATDAADPGSVTSSGLSAGTEYLTTRVTAYEAAAISTGAATSGWTSLTNPGGTPAGTTGGSGVTNMSVRAEYIIASGNTSQASDPTITSCDSASVIASFYEVSSGPTTHATSGALTGQIGSVSGAARHNIPHATSGALTGQIGSVAGTAAHIAVHGTSGALTGQIGSVAGTASRFVTHTSSGALTGQIGSISGAASRSTTHATDGVLAGPGATVSGSATRFRTFAASGALTGPGSQIVGAATRSINGTLAATDAQDTTVFNAILLATGTLSSTDTQDAATFSGSVSTGVSGTLAATDAQDTATFAGTIYDLITGTLFGAETQDIAAFSATLITTGTLTAADTQDAAALSGNVFGTVSGTLAVYEAQDVMVMLGSAGGGAIFGVGGSAVQEQFVGNEIALPYNVRMRTA